MCSWVLLDRHIWWCTCCSSFLCKYCSPVAFILNSLIIYNLTIHQNVPYAGFFKLSNPFPSSGSYYNCCLHHPQERRPSSGCPYCNVFEFLIPPYTKCINIQSHWVTTDQTLMRSATLTSLVISLLPTKWLMHRIITKHSVTPCNIHSVCNNHRVHPGSIALLLS